MSKPKSGKKRTQCVQKKCKRHQKEKQRSDYLRNMYTLAFEKVESERKKKLPRSKKVVEVSPAPFE